MMRIRQQIGNAEVQTGAQKLKHILKKWSLWK